MEPQFLTIILLVINMFVVIFGAIGLGSKMNSSITLAVERTAKRIEDRFEKWIQDVEKDVRKLEREHFSCPHCGRARFTSP